MKDDILPIGSIISVEGQDFMICAYINKKAKINNEHYDYACCKYPGGLTEKAILVKKSKINCVRFIGFISGKFLALKEDLENSNE